MPGCWQDWNGLEEVTEVTEGLEWMLDGRRGLEGHPTRSSFRSSADFLCLAEAALHIDVSINSTFLQTCSACLHLGLIRSVCLLEGRSHQLAFWEAFLLVAKFRKDPEGPLSHYIDTSLTLDCFLYFAQKTKNMNPARPQLEFVFPSERY